MEDGHGAGRADGSISLRRSPIHQINVKDNLRLTASDRPVQGRDAIKLRNRPSGSRRRWAAEPMCGICGIVGRADRGSDRVDDRDARPPGARRRRRRGSSAGRREASRRARPPAAEHHRPDPARRAADGVCGQALLDHLQRRALQLPRAARASSSARASASPSDCDTEVLLAMYAEHGAGDARPAERDLRVRDLGHRAERAVPGARPAGRQAALLGPARRRPRTSPRR